MATTIHNTIITNPSAAMWFRNKICKLTRQGESAAIAVPESVTDPMALGPSQDDLTVKLILLKSYDSLI
jgi:hypothetical protein